ncbi:MAG: hypothetical protein WCZ98_04365 [Sideroxydans sp.]
MTNPSRHITKKTTEELNELLDYIKTSMDLLSEGIERDGEPMTALEIKTDTGPIMIVIGGGKCVGEMKAAMGFSDDEAHWLMQGTPVESGENLPALEAFVKKNL